jgi:hypothetical protein
LHTKRRCRKSTINCLICCITNDINKRLFM